MPPYGPVDVDVDVVVLESELPPKVEGKIKSVSSAKLSSKKGVLSKINVDPSPPPAWIVIDRRWSPPTGVIRLE